MPTGTCFNIWLIQLLCFFTTKYNCEQDCIMLLLGLFKLPVKNISRTSVQDLTFVLRHLHLRTWVCTYSLWLCWAWGPHFIHRNCWPNHPMPPPGKHWSCRRTSVVPWLHQEFSLLPRSWVADSCNRQPWPLTAVLQASAGICFPGGEQRTATPAGSAFGWADTSMSCPFPDSKCKPCSLSSLLGYSVAPHHDRLIWKNRFSYCLFSV